MYTWRHFSMAIAAFLAVAAIFSFIAGTHPVSSATRTFDAIRFATVTLAVGLALGFTVWGGLRVIKGRDAPDLKETVMLLATLFGVVCVGMVVFR